MAFSLFPASNHPAIERDRPPGLSADCLPAWIGAYHDTFADMFAGTMIGKLFPPIVLHHKFRPKTFMKRKAENGKEYYVGAQPNRTHPPVVHGSRRLHRKTKQVLAIRLQTLAHSSRWHGRWDPWPVS